ncbi:hypothetical protein C1645_871001 [Glomus cerebriforme]|uniref:Uncharacterized protein n=1 Tax=Glomus cerebriforme TaxID=658196 RepID=A0A397TS46_9GLOM|nr:hypothetical protein C1645_871001 [Glomus cerebriforme]
MSTTSSNPTPAELDQAKRLYNDVNDYLEYLTDIIQSKVQEFDEDFSDDDDELSPSVSQFLNDYKDYISSLPKVHNQLINSDSSSTSNNNNNSTKCSILRKRFWRYSQSNQMLQLLPPNLFDDLQKLCEAKLDRSVQGLPSFSTSLPTIDNNNEKLLTNDSSPSVALLKSQLEKYTKEKEKNCIVIRSPKYSSFDDPIEEKKIVFVVKKSTAVIVAPPTIESPKQDPIKEETEEKNSTIENEKSEVVEEVLSEKKVKKSKTEFDFLSNFLSITKVGFSKSQLSTLIWA